MLNVRIANFLPTVSVSIDASAFDGSILDCQFLLLPYPMKTIPLRTGDREGHFGKIVIGLAIPPRQTLLPQAVAQGRVRPFRNGGSGQFCRRPSERKMIDLPEVIVRRTLMKLSRC